MSDLLIVQQKTVGMGPTGNDANTQEVYIKVLVSFEDRLMQLKNARLSVFMSVALNEARILLGQGKPLSSRKLEKRVPYSRPSIMDALDYLTDYHFIVELDELGTDGEKQYRVCNYAWFGTSGLSAFHPDNVADIPAQPHDAQLIASKPGGQEFYPPPPCGSSQQPSAPPVVCKDSLHPSKKISLQEEVEGTLSSIKNSESSSTPSTFAAVKKIFAEVGFYGNDLNDRACTVGIERAKRWAKWVRWALVNRTEFSSPKGIANKHLKKDCEAEPPDPMDVIDEWEHAQREDVAIREYWLKHQQTDDGHNPEIAVEPDPMSEYTTHHPELTDSVTGQANAVWRATLGELQLQMTKAVFDTWVRPTHVLGWKDGGLYVGVHSPYAKEWLENRLNATVQRTVIGIVGRSVEVRYVYADKHTPRQPLRTLDDLSPDHSIASQQRQALQTAEAEQEK